MPLYDDWFVNVTVKFRLTSSSVVMWCSRLTDCFLVPERLRDPRRNMINMTWTRLPGRSKIYTSSACTRLTPYQCGKSDKCLGSSFREHFMATTPMNLRLITLCPISSTARTARSTGSVDVGVRSKLQRPGTTFWAKTLLFPDRSRKLRQSRLFHQFADASPCINTLMNLD